MVMRIEVDFPKPIQGEHKTGFLLALAVLPKTARVRFVDGGRRALVMGEALGLDRVRSALEDEGVSISALRTSLPEYEDLRADDVSDDHPARKERLRPIGR